MLTAERERERPMGHDELTPTIEADLALSLLYVSNAFFHLMLAHIAFSLATLIPTHNGQKCLDFQFW